MPGTRLTMTSFRAGNGRTSARAEAAAARARTWGAHVRASRLARRSAWSSLVLVCIAAVAVYGELSVQSLVAVSATGAVFVTVGLARRAGERADRVGRRAAPWSVWLAAVLGWELSTLRVDRLPTLSDLMDPVLAHPVARGAATAAWLAAGAWLIARPAPRDQTS